MYDYEDKIQTVLKQLDACKIKSESAVTFLYKPTDYKTDNTLPSVDSSFKEFTVGSHWGMENDAHAWFYAVVEVPKAEADEYVSLYVANEAGWDATNPQYIAYVNGKMFCGLDNNHREIVFDAPGKYEIYLYGYSGEVEKASRLSFSAKLRTNCRLSDGLYWDIIAPLQVAMYTDVNTKIYKDIMLGLNEAASFIDFRVPQTEEYRASVKKARKFMKDKFYGEYCKEQETSVVCIGHTHIDIAWLWTVRQTREKAQRSFATVLYLMDRYPEYKFMSSQAILYAIVKEEAPELYAKIKERVKEGRWEVEGGMWLEADCNIPSGESLVRQIMFGKKFFKEEFGVDSKILWLPDVFGYSAALPQILKKSGIDTFVTSKISWNDTNRMPYDTFMWKGIDGSSVFTYFLTAQNKERGKDTKRFATYNGTTTAQQIAGTWDRYEQKELHNEALLTYGYGDGGGGPTREMLELVDRLKYGVPNCPNARIDTVTDFISRLKVSAERTGRIPEWCGELYLEYHRGTYTTQAAVKYNNRKCEYLLANAEWINCVSKALCGTEYPQAELNDNWRTLLTNQFHDIIPGSSIKSVYEVCAKEYKILFANCENIISKAALSIAQNVKTDKKHIVFNPMPFETDGVVEFNGEYFNVGAVPAHGYKAVDLKSSKHSIKITERSLENGFFEIELDKYKQISRIFDKKNKREILKQGQSGNVLEVYEDLAGRWDAWDIKAYYKEKCRTIDDVSGIEIIESGAKSGLKITRKFLQTTVSQTIWLYEKIGRIDFETEVDWHIEHSLLKAHFPFDIHADKATYDIQFGNLERNTHKNTSWDAAKFEVCAHKFADISELGYGVAVLNDCKYGHDISGSDVRLTLLRAPKYPDANADMGKHKFTYSLYPHAGDFGDADVYKQAYALNNPMFVEKASGLGKLPESYSFISISAKGVIADTIKKAENSESICVRAFQSLNLTEVAEISFGTVPKAAHICDLLENDLESVKINGNKIKVAFKPFEIITLKIDF